MLKLKWFAMISVTLFFCSCIKDSGKVQYTYTKATAQYGDLQAVRTMPLNGTSSAVINPGKIYVGDDFILLGEEGIGIHVIDNSVKESPSFINFINVPSNKEFFVKDQVLYADSHYDFVKIDLTNLQQVKLIDRAENAIAETIFNDKGEALIRFDFEVVTEEFDANDPKVNSFDNYQYYDYAQDIIPNSVVPSSFAGSAGNKSGTINRIATLEDYVYLINNNKILYFKDNGSNITYDHEEDIWSGGDLQTILAHDGNVFIGTSSSVIIMNGDNPAELIQSSTFDHGDSCDPVFPIEDVAYSTLRTGDARGGCPGDINALLVLNIADLNFVKLENEIEMLSPFGLTKIGNQLYVGEGENGLKIFDITDKFNPVQIVHHKDIVAYDMIADPNNPNQLLISGPNGLSQYELGQVDLALISRVQF